MSAPAGTTLKARAEMNVAFQVGVVVAVKKATMIKGIEPIRPCQAISDSISTWWRPRRTLTTTELTAQKKPAVTASRLALKPAHVPRAQNEHQAYERKND